MKFDTGALCDIYHKMLKIGTKEQYNFWFTEWCSENISDDFKRYQFYVECFLKKLPWSKYYKFNRENKR